MFSLSCKELKQTNVGQLVHQQASLHTRHVEAPSCLECLAGSSNCLVDIGPRRCLDRGELFLRCGVYRDDRLLAALYVFVVNEQTGLANTIVSTGEPGRTIGKEKSTWRDTVRPLAEIDTDCGVAADIVLNLHCW
jgi:hypothetical protein